MFWGIVGIAAGITVLFFALFSKNEPKESNDIPQPAYVTLFALLIICFVFLLFYKVTEVPLPYHVDEASIAYDASSIVKYHCDRHLYRFPLLFKSFGGAGQNALYTYLAAIMIKLFGKGILSVRLPAILLSIISAIMFSLLLRKTRGSVSSILSLLFFCILPFSIMHSRWALESYLLFPMLIISCSVFYIAVNKEKLALFFLSGCLFGITLYSYGISYMLLPLFLGILVFYLLVIKKISIRNLLAMACPLFLLAVPLILMLAINFGFIDEIRTRYFSIPKLPEFRAGDVSLQYILENLSFTDKNLFYRFFCNDFLTYNVIPEYGTVYYLSIPLILCGFIVCLKRCLNDLRNKRFSLDLLMMTLFITVYLVCLTITSPNVNRLNGLYIPVIYFLVIAASEILKRNKIAAAAGAVLYLLTFCFFIHTYFVDFPKRIEHHLLITSINDLEDAVDLAVKVVPEDETIYILDFRLMYIYGILAADIDPFTFDREKVFSYDGYLKSVGRFRFRKDAILPECVYIFNNPLTIPDDIDSYGFNSKKFGSVMMYYPGSVKGVVP